MAIFAAAPFAGAWVKIVKQSRMPRLRLSYPSRVRGLEYFRKFKEQNCRRTLRGCVGWNENDHEVNFLSHPSTGCVGWNGHSPAFSADGVRRTSHGCAG